MMNLAQMTSTHSIRKPTKAQAQAMVKELANRLGEENPRIVKDLASLYAFFMPPKVKKPKTSFDWVALAMGNKDIRHYLNYVHVTSQYVMATDGHRMHRALNTTGLSPGFYLRNGDKAHEPDYARFPDVDRVIPSKASRTHVHTVKFNDLPVADHEKTATKAFSCCTLPHGTKVDKQYLEQAFAGIDEADVYEGRSNESVLIEHPYGLAVVMPLRA